MGNVPNLTTLPTTSTLLEAGELEYCDDVTEHLYVNDVLLANNDNFAGLIVSTAS